MGPFEGSAAPGSVPFAVICGRSGAFLGPQRCGRSVGAARAHGGAVGRNERGAAARGGSVGAGRTAEREAGSAATPSAATRGRRTALRHGALMSRGSSSFRNGKWLRSRDPLGVPLAQCAISKMAAPHHLGSPRAFLDPPFSRPLPDPSAPPAAAGSPALQAGPRSHAARCGAVAEALAASSRGALQHRALRSRTRTRAATKRSLPARTVLPCCDLAAPHPGASRSPPGSVAAPAPAQPLQR